MKQIILPLILFLFIFQIGLAQVSLSLTPNPVEASGVADPDDLFFEIIGYATLKNEGTETVSIKWERVVVDMPGEWESLVCDFHQCYVAAVYSNIADNLGLNEPVVLAPGESSNLDVHAIPKGVTGSAEIRIDVSLTNEPDNIILSGTYLFNASPVSSSKDLNKAKLAVFPNPATDYVEVQGAPAAGRLAIYNVIGRQMRSFNLAPGSRYYVGDLPAGLYLASVLNRKGEIMRTFRLSKRSLRP